TSERSFAMIEAGAAEEPAEEESDPDRDIARVSSTQECRERPADNSHDGNEHDRGGLWSETVQRCPHYLEQVIRRIQADDDPSHAIDGEPAALPDDRREQHAHHQERLKHLPEIWRPGA